QRALGIAPSIELREDAPAIRLGAVDDTAAAERLDERGPKARTARETPRREESRDRSPRGFERRETRERPATARREHTANDETKRPSRGFERRDATPRAENPRGRGKEAVVSFFNDSKGFGFASDDK